jgi:SAM-dependent methyltransferase
MNAADTGIAGGPAVRPAKASKRGLLGMIQGQLHGYPGDWDVVDRIYRHWISPDPDLAKWDRFFQAQAAPRAIRNRKDCFQAWLREAEAKRHAVLPVLCLLHLGGGSGREVVEYFKRAPYSRLLCTFVENDARAIAYAARLCSAVCDRVNFVQANPAGFRPAISPHLIWAAGLCDHLGDDAVAALVRRLWQMLAPGGELVLSSFSPACPTRPYLDVLGWTLHYRDSGHLCALARQAGVSAGATRVSAEPEGSILFLHLEKGPG